MASRAQQTRADAAHRRALKPFPDDPLRQARLKAFVQGLQQLGWTDGGNMRIDTRGVQAMPIGGRTFVWNHLCQFPF